jgi:hypothetical protein
MVIPEKVQDAGNRIGSNVEEGANHILGGTLIVVSKSLCIHRIRHWTWESEFLIKKLNLTGRDGKNSGTGFLGAVYYYSISLFNFSRHFVETFITDYI